MIEDHRSQSTDSRMANITIVSCSSLASRTNFASYIATIKDVTGNNLTLVDQCRAEVCNALWGSGNPDVSGIGVCQGVFLSESCTC